MQIRFHVGRSLHLACRELYCERKAEALAEVLQINHCEESFVERETERVRGILTLFSQRPIKNFVALNYSAVKLRRRLLPRDFYALRGERRAVEILRRRFGNSFQRRTKHRGRPWARCDAVERSDAYGILGELSQAGDYRFRGRPAVNGYCLTNSSIWTEIIYVLPFLGVIYGVAQKLTVP